MPIVGECPLCPLQSPNNTGHVVLARPLKAYGHLAYSLAKGREREKLVTLPPSALGQGDPSL